jgi:hypothetical protein
MWSEEEVKAHAAWVHEQSAKMVEEDWVVEY